MEMTFTTGLMVGLLVGWLIEYVIDFMFWRKGSNEVQDLRLRLRDSDASLLTANNHIQALDFDISEKDARNQTLQEALSAANREVAGMKAQLAAIKASEPETLFIERDPLHEIDGLDPQTADLLRSRGVITFDQLSRMEVDEVAELAELEQTPEDIQAWIQAASQFVTPQNGAVS